MKTINTLLMIVLIGLIAFAIGTQQSRPVAASGEQRWEYAEVEYSSTLHIAILMMTNEAAARPLVDSFNQIFSNHDKPSSVYYLNEMGNAGWELINTHPAEGVVYYVFKRPL